MRPTRGAGRERVLSPGRGLWAIGVLGLVPLVLWEAGRLVAGTRPEDALFVGIGLGLGALAADGLSGLVHWACDTWGDEDTPWLGPTLIYAFREHHARPRKMVAHHWIDVSREPAAAAFLGLLLVQVPPLAAWLAGHPTAHGFWLALALFGALSNQLHRWAHAGRVPGPVAWLQRRGWILSPRRHAAHHRPPHDVSYCVCTGWLNPLLDRTGFWRRLEHAVEAFTGGRSRGSAAGRG